MLHQYDKAISELEKSLDMYDKLGLKPWYSSNYYQLIAAYYETGQYKKWGKLYKKAEKDFPDDYRLHATHATLLLTLGDTLKANEYIEKCIFQRKLSSVSEAEITRLLALIYSNAGVLDKAEDYYRKALSLEPGKLQRLLNLGHFLIEKDRNIEEGLRIARKALELSPDNYDFLHTIGWGLFKQGKYQESLVILQKSWDLRRQNAIYDHEAYLHLEAAKKAVAEQTRAER